jgi:hypothetical protein
MGVETALAATGLAATVGTTAMSFIGAGKERKKQREAERAAEKAMAEVRKQLSVNYFDQVAIKKEPYELQREALLSQGALAIQAGVESGRGGAPTAGRVQMAMNEGQAGIRTSMGERLDVIEQQALEEDSRLRDLNTQLTLEQVAGAQTAAANSAEAAAAANQQGVEGIISGVQQGIAMIPLFNGEDGDITVSGSNKGPGPNRAFQSSTADRFNSSSSGVSSINQNMPNTASKLNPFLYENMFSGVGGYRNA